MEPFVVVLIILPFVGALVFNIGWLLIGARRNSRAAVVGDAVTKTVDLRPNETVAHTVGAIRQFRSKMYVSGRIYFTNERLIFSPTRYPIQLVDTGGSFGLDYHDIKRWYVKRRWAIGIGDLPWTRNAIIVESASQQEQAFWPAPGYDLIGAFTRFVPSTAAQASGVQSSPNS